MNARLTHRHDGLKALKSEYAITCEQEVTAPSSRGLMSLMEDMAVCQGVCMCVR